MPFRIPLSPDAFGLQRDFAAGSLVHELSKREYEVLCTLATGRNNTEVAELLGIRESSVVNHLTNIYRVLELPQNSNARVAASLIAVRDCGRNPFKSENRLLEA